jgi:uncharacterized protein Yka (UPF0111/DUF47 family)
MALPRLLPKNDQFLDMIEQLAQAVCACPQYLKAYLEPKDATARKRAGESIIEARAASKDLAAQITAELCRSYVTPFDRDDIQDFTAALYRIPKIMEKVKERLDLHGLEGATFGGQIDVIMQEAQAMEDLVRDLVRKPDSRRIQDKIKVLYDLENDGDKILMQLLSELFQNFSEARDLILRKDIYDMLEKVIDAYRDAAGVALQIVLKHG